MRFPNIVELVPLCCMIFAADSAAVPIGQAHLFDAQTGTLVRTFDDPSPIGGPRVNGFGESVAIEDGLILIGDPFDESRGIPRDGQGYLFDAPTGTLLQTYDNPGLTESLGWAVALAENRALIGAGGAAYSFDLNTGDVLQTYTPTGGSAFRFGEVVATSNGRDLVGSRGPSDSVYLFNPEDGNQVRRFVDPMSQPNDRFGASVALDNTRVLVGDPNGSTSPDFVDEAHLFDQETGVLLRTFDDPTPTDGTNLFGESVALLGGLVLVGAPRDSTSGLFIGVAHLFNAMTGELIQTFEDPTPSLEDSFSLGDSFGQSVAISDHYVLIGAPNHQRGNRVGQAHLFDLSTGDLLWTFDDPTPTGGNAGDRFGYSVALSGDHVLIGAPAHGLFSSAVPEPTTLVLLSLGLAALGVARRPSVKSVR